MTDELFLALAMQRTPLQDGVDSDAAALFASTAPLPFVSTAAHSPAASIPASTPATPTAAAVGVPGAALPAASVVDIHSLQSSAPANAARTALGSPGRSVRVGAGVAAWLLALGGVGTAAAMSGLLSVAVDGLFGIRRVTSLTVASEAGTTR